MLVSAFLHLLINQRIRASFLISRYFADDNIWLAEQIWRIKTQDNLRNLSLQECLK